MFFPLLWVWLSVPVHLITGRTHLQNDCYVLSETLISTQQQWRRQD